MDTRIETNASEVRQKKSRRNRRRNRNSTCPRRRFSGQESFSNVGDASNKDSLEVCESSTDLSSDHDFTNPSTIWSSSTRVDHDSDCSVGISGQTANTRTDSRSQLEIGQTKTLCSRLREVDALCAKLIRWDSSDPLRSGIVRDFREMKFESQRNLDSAYKQFEVPNVSQNTSTRQAIPNISFEHINHLPRRIVSKVVQNSPENVSSIGSLDNTFGNESREQKASQSKLDHLNSSVGSLRTTLTSL